MADEAGMVDVIAAEEEKLIDSVRYGCIQNVDVSNAISRVCERLEAYPRLKDATITGVYVGLGGKSLSSKIVEVSTTLPAEMEITAQLVADLKAKAETMVDTSRESWTWSRCGSPSTTRRKTTPSAHTASSLARVWQP